MKWIDTHCHLDVPEYDHDREEVIKKTLDAGGGLINIGVDTASSIKIVELAHTYPSHVWAIIGVHPTDNLEVQDFKILEKLAQDEKVIAIGECGFDFSRAGEGDKTRQRELFIKHIEIANQVNKPLMLHVRNSKTDLTAYSEALEVLKNNAKVPFNFHFFTGLVDDLDNIMAAGGTVSFSGVISFTDMYDEVVRKVPMDRFLTETDAPFASPLPYRGKRNEPIYVLEVIRAIARIKGETEEKVAQQSVDNARRIFGI